MVSVAERLLVDAMLATLGAADIHLVEARRGG